MNRDFSSLNDEILYNAMDMHSAYFNFYDFVKTGIPKQVHDQDLYTLDEVAEITKMSVTTIRKYVREGKLKGIKQWKNWMIPSNEIAKLIYEKSHGVELDENTVMLFISSGDLFEEDNIIPEYEFITAKDLLESVNRDNLFFSIETYMKSIVIDAQHIEAVSNVKNFFRRTGDLKNEDWKKNDLPIYDLIVTPFDKLQFFQENANKLLDETASDALKTIEKIFGPIDDQLTLLKVYRTLLAFAYNSNIEE